MGRHNRIRDASRIDFPARADHNGRVRLGFADMLSCVHHAPGFSLSHTLESGQYFRYAVKDGVYSILRGQRYFRVRQDGETLHYDGADLWFLREFLGLDQDYATIERSLRRDRRLWEALDAYPGLRILRQDP